MIEEKTYTMDQILKALEVSGIKLVATRKKFFDAILSQEDKLTEEEQIERVRTMGY